MSAPGNTKRTPTSSNSSGQGARNLAQELQDVEDRPMPDIKYDEDGEALITKDVFDALLHRLEKAERRNKRLADLANDNSGSLVELQEAAKATQNDFAQVQGIINELSTSLEGEKSANKKLQDQLRTLRAAANIIETPIHDGREKLKLNSPVTYDGTPGQLKGFLIQVKNYQSFHRSSFKNDTERVIHAATFLRGRALQWIEPFQEQFLEAETLDNCTTEVRDIFSTFEGFEHALRTLFQDPDQKRQAERDLATLRQTKSATHYAAEFRRIGAQLDLTEESRIFMFYQGLKDEVKDELVKIDRPEDFLQYAELAIKIDNRLWERRREKGERRPIANSSRKHQWPPRQFQYRNQGQQPQRNNWPNRRSTAYGHHAGPMDLSAAERQELNKGRTFKCYNCDKPGHMAKDCRQPKKQRWQPVPGGKQLNAAFKEEDHAKLSWTACYSDDIPKKTLAVAYKAPHRKLDRKAREQLDSMGPRQAYYDLTTPSDEEVRHENERIIQKLNELIEGLRYAADMEPDEDHAEHARTLLTRRNERMAARANLPELRRLNAENAERERTMAYPMTQEIGQESDTPYDSDEPRDVARRRAQNEITWGARPDTQDSDSEEEPLMQKKERKNLLHIPLNDDQQRILFYGTDPVRKTGRWLPKHMPGDHEWLNTLHEKHRNVFWSQCLEDECQEHLAEKIDSRFFPRRKKEAPRRNIYLAEELHMWTIREFKGTEEAVFGPNPRFPMRCLHDDNMNWSECYIDQCQVHYVEKARTFRRKRLQEEKGTSFAPPVLNIKNTLERGGTVKYPNGDGTYTERRLKQSKN